MDSTRWHKKACTELIDVGAVGSFVPVAQLVEHRFEEPGVAGSIPAGNTNFFTLLAHSSIGRAPDC